MTWNRTRLGGWALIIGTIVATIGYLAAGTLVRTHGDARFTSSLWEPLNSIAIAGNIIIALGLPVILTCHDRRATRLTIVGYAGLFATLVMLNISESCYEALIKLYLATHGGVPSNPPGGFAIFEDIALVFLLARLICLGIAVDPCPRLPALDRGAIHRLTLPVRPRAARTPRRTQRLPRLHRPRHDRPAGPAYPNGEPGTVAQPGRRRPCHTLTQNSLAGPPRTARDRPIARRSPTAGTLLVQRRSPVRARRSRHRNGAYYRK